MRINYGDFVLKSLVIIGLGLSVFLIDTYEFLADNHTTWAIVGLAICKIIFIVWQSTRMIIEVTANDTPFYRFLLFIIVNVMMVTFSFAIDYFCLYHVNPLCFSGVDKSLSLPEVFFECFYFSVLNFTNFGYGEILPQIIPAKVLVMMEDLLSFFTIILVLSDFVSLKESLLESNFLKKRLRQKEKAIDENDEV